MNKSVKYTPEQLAFVRRGYRKWTILELTERYNARFGAGKTPDQLKRITAKHGYRSGRSGRFVSGHTPWNGGTKGQGLTRANRCSFKPGNVPHTHLPVGSEKATIDGYLWVKIAEPRQWRQKHRLIWEEAHGPVPAGMCVVFKDNNRRNFALDNLELITRKELVRLNKLRCGAFPQELRPSIKLLAAISIRRGARARQTKKEARP